MQFHQEEEQPLKKRKVSMGFGMLESTEVLAEQHAHETQHSSVPKFDSELEQIDPPNALGVEEDVERPETDRRILRRRNWQVSRWWRALWKHRFGRWRKPNDQKIAREQIIDPSLRIQLGQTVTAVEAEAIFQASQQVPHRKMHEGGREL